MSPSLHGVALTWYEYFNGRDHIYFMIGVSLLAGLGGSTTVDFLLQVFRRSITGIQVNLDQDDEEK